MKVLYENLPEVEIGGRKLVGRVLFGLLILIAILVGATGGLLLVYTTDLPQVDALEAYRPSSITELYDDHGKVIGSFALQRRVVVGYDDFPPVLRDALVSIEDKDFYRHSGINFWRIVGAAYRDIESGGKVQGASTLTMQLARNLFLSPIAIGSARCRRRCSPSRSSAGSPSRRFSLCTPTRLRLDMECSASKPLQSFTSASPQSS